MELDEEASDDKVACSSLIALLVGAKEMLFDVELLDSRRETSIFEIELLEWKLCGLGMLEWEL